VFERFARGRAAAAPGSGLGLAIVRRIAERHGAGVELADGALGRGLAVTVTFPAAEGASAATM
jgi:signal transduction histidine kinase